jgi:hypothetical protein
MFHSTCAFKFIHDCLLQEDDDKPLNAAHPGSSCKLAPPIQELIQLIFDVNLMKQVMLEFEVGMRSSAVAVLNIETSPILSCF